MDSVSRKVAHVVTKAWTDPKYMKRLRADPKSVLHEAGIYVRGDKVELHEESDKVSHFVIPKRPSHLSDEDLKRSDVHPDLCCTVCLI